MKQTLVLLTFMSAVPALADVPRQMDAHEHGLSKLNIAIDGTALVMELHAPGIDIAGFEYVAESDAERTIIDEVTKILGAPLNLFVLPNSAGCVVKDSEAGLEGDHAHDGHGHAHESQAGQIGHSEFYAEYTLSCENPDALTKITFAYFEVFPNAKAVDVQIIEESGVQAFKVDRNSPVLNMVR